MNKQLIFLFFTLFLSLNTELYSMVNPTVNLQLNSISFTHNTRTWHYTTQDIDTFKKMISHIVCSDERKKYLVDNLSQSWKKVTALSALVNTYPSENARQQLAEELLKIDDIITTYDLRKKNQQHSRAKYITVGVITAGIAAFTYWQRDTLEQLSNRLINVWAGKIVATSFRQQLCSLYKLLPSSDSLKNTCTTIASLPALQGFSISQFDH